MCGIVAIANLPKAAELAVMGLHVLQHRAREYAGVVTTDGENFYHRRGKGLAREVFDRSKKLNMLHGDYALGHIRYSTVADDRSRDNAQPILGLYGCEPVAVAHNGNLTNTNELAEALSGVPMATSMDTEYILKLLERSSSGNLVEDLAAVFARLRGSYSLCFLFRNRLIAVRDPRGNRPLSVGVVENGAGAGYVVASESAVFSSLDATLLQNVAPGTMLIIDENGLSEHRFAEPSLRQCSFELVYYANPASEVYGKGVSEFRRELGQALERIAPANADIVVPIPDSARFIAMGYAETGRSGVYQEAILRNHDSGRSFIAPTQAKRDEEVARKFIFNARAVRGKRIVLIDDSIVRGTTLPKIIRKLWKVGAREIHVRIGSPPITGPCNYGIDTPSKEHLIAAYKTPPKIRDMFGATSLEYFPLEAFKAVYGMQAAFCFACMDNNYWDL